MQLVKSFRYLFMGQRYAYSGTVVEQTPTHVTLGPDAQIHYEDIGGLEDWASGKLKTAKKNGSVPGQIVSVIGCDITPIP